MPKSKLSIRLALHRTVLSRLYWESCAEKGKKKKKSWVKLSEATKMALILGVHRSRYEIVLKSQTTKIGGILWSRRIVTVKHWTEFQMHQNHTEQAKRGWVPFQRFPVGRIFEGQQVPWWIGEHTRGAYSPCSWWPFTEFIQSSW